MTRLHEALQELAEEAPRPDLTRRVMTRARRRRRARLLTAPVMAVGAVAVVATGSLPGGGGPGGDTGPTVAPSGRVLNAGALPKPLPGHRVEPVKYAYLDWCGAQKGPHTDACTRWRVVDESGKQWLVADSLGSSSYIPGGSAPLEISAHGNLIAYYRPSDEHIVVRNLRTGHVTVVGRRLSLDYLKRNGFVLMFSGDGRRLAISFSSEGPVHALLADTATGSVHELPGAWVIGLGKDASTVTLADDNGNRTTLILAGSDGRLLSRVPLDPNLHLTGTDNTVASDGHTLLALPGPEKTGLSDARPEHTAVLVDVRTGKETGRRNLRLPKGVSLFDLVGWADDRRVLISTSPMSASWAKDGVMVQQGYIADLHTGQTQVFGSIALRTSQTSTTFGDYGS